MTPIRRTPELFADYLTGRLPDSELVGFEEACAGDPGLVAELEDSLRLREGLEVLRDQGHLDRLALPRGPVWSRWVFGVALAAAAAVAIVAVLPGIRLVHRETIVSRSIVGLAGGASSPLPVVARYSFAAMRHSQQTLQLALPRSGALEFSVRASPAEGAHTFQVLLEEVHTAGAPVVVGGAASLVPTDGFVAVYVDASLLRPGDYSLTVTPEGTTGTTGDRFTFALSASAGGMAPTP